MAATRPDTIRSRKNALHTCGRCGGSLGNQPGAYRRRQIPAQVLVGVEFGRVRRQVDHFDILHIAGAPLMHAVRPPSMQAVNDLEPLALRVPNQILQEDFESLGINRALEEQALASVRRYHLRRVIATGHGPALEVPVSTSQSSCCEPTSSPCEWRPSRPNISRDSHFRVRISPRALVLQPRLEPDQIQLRRDVDKLLRRKVPGHRTPHRQVSAEALLDAEHDRAALPQSEPKLTLCGIEHLIFKCTRSRCTRVSVSHVQ